MFEFCTSSSLTRRHVEVVDVEDPVRRHQPGARSVCAYRSPWPIIHVGRVELLGRAPRGRLLLPNPATYDIASAFGDVASARSDHEAQPPSQSSAPLTWRCTGMPGPVMHVGIFAKTTGRFGTSALVPPRERGSVEPDRQHLPRPWHWR